MLPQGRTAAIGNAIYHATGARLLSFRNQKTEKLTMRTTFHNFLAAILLACGATGTATPSTWSRARAKSWC